MINSVRNTVLSILNKNNYGYISPSDFNLFAKQAQLDIFTSFMSDYNKQINKENSRISGTEYADLRKAIEADIDGFSVTNPLQLDSSNKYFLPSLTTTGDEAFFINKVLSYTELLANGTTDGTVVAENQCVDSTADFIEDGVAAGDIVALISDSIVEYVTVLAVTETSITTTGALWTVTDIPYAVYRPTKKEMESVTHSKITMLENAPLIMPKTDWPAYTQEGIRLTAYPSEISTVGRVVAQYLRFPREPKWTFVSLTSGEPMFDQSQPDYQDFELSLDFENMLVSKILQYAGMSIREITAVQFGQADEQMEKQAKQ